MNHEIEKKSKVCLYICSINNMILNNLQNETEYY